MEHELVELETVRIYETDSLASAYRLSRALYEVGVPSYLTNGAGTGLPAADEGEIAADEAGPAPYAIAVYTADVDLAADIVAETFGA
jgi:hypothetical protein